MKKLRASSIKDCLCSSSGCLEPSKGGVQQQHRLSPRLVHVPLQPPSIKRLRTALLPLGPINRCRHPTILRFHYLWKVIHTCMKEILNIKIAILLMIVSFKISFFLLRYPLICSSLRLFNCGWCQVRFRNL